MYVCELMRSWYERYVSNTGYHIWLMCNWYEQHVSNTDYHICICGLTFVQLVWNMIYIEGYASDTNCEWNLNLYVDKCRMLYMLKDVNLFWFLTSVGCYTCGMMCNWYEQCEWHLCMYMYWYVKCVQAIWTVCNTWII